MCIDDEQDAVDRAQDALDLAVPRLVAQLPEIRAGTIRDIGYHGVLVEIDRELDHAGLSIVKSILTQPGFNGNRVLLLEKR